MLNRREMISASVATLVAGSVRSAPLFGYLGGDIRDEAPYLGLAAKSDLPNFSNYFALGQLLRDMRTKAATIRTRVGQFADAFTDQTGINAGASQYYAYDFRKVMGPDRAFRNTVAPEETFDSIASWTTKVGATVINSGERDPNIGSVAELNTGSTAGAVAALRKYFGAIPATFGVSVLMGIATSNGSAAEALELQVQNNQGHQLKMRVYLGAVQFFYNGVWNTLFSYGGSLSTLTEWWIEVAHNGSSSYLVRLFAGTQELPGFTGRLPNGPTGENGWVGFIQHSSTAANRRGRIAFLQVGSSALPANMNLVSVAQDVVTEPTTVSMALVYEDVSLQTVLNTDLKAWVSKDGGATWHQVILGNYNKYYGGVLDRAKPVYLAAGEVALPANGTSNVCCRIASANGRYFSLEGYAWRVDA